MRNGLAKIVGGRRDAGKRNPGPGNEPRVAQIPVESVSPNPFQPRTDFDEQGLAELTESIKEHGLLQPIVVRQAGDGYELIAGERRLMASKLAGLHTVPALIRDASQQEMAELALIENLQRRDLSCVEEAAGYQRLIQEFGLTQEDLASRVGKDQSTIANKIRLLKLPKDVLGALSQGLLTERHARSLLRLQNEADQIEVLEKIVQRGLNVSQTEALVEEIGQRNGREGAGIRRGRTVVKVLKDIRIFLNGIQTVVEQLRETGIDVAVEEFDHDDRLELHIEIPKRRSK